jgi:putative FmdB family regulatory protein
MWPGIRPAGAALKGGSPCQTVGAQAPFDVTAGGRYNKVGELQNRRLALPLYEYKCRKCGRRFERICKFSDPPLTECDVCGGEVDQLLSSPAFQFKGSGFYVNDYARKPSAGSGSSTADAPSASDKKDDKKEEKKEKESTKSTEPAKVGSGKD